MMAIVVEMMVVNKGIDIMWDFCRIVVELPRCGEVTL
jgi:hypothetical protein